MNGPFRVFEFLSSPSPSPSSSRPLALAVGVVFALTPSSRSLGLWPLASPLPIEPSPATLPAVAIAVAVAITPELMPHAPRCHHHCPNSPLRPPSIGPNAALALASTFPFLPHDSVALQYLRWGSLQVTACISSTIHCRAARHIPGIYPWYGIYLAYAWYIPPPIF